MLPARPLSTFSPLRNRNSGQIRPLAGAFLVGILIAPDGCQNEKTQWTLDEALKLVGTEQAAR